MEPCVVIVVVVHVFLGGALVTLNLTGLLLLLTLFSQYVPDLFLNFWGYYAYIYILCACGIEQQVLFLLFFQGLFICIGCVCVIQEGDRIHQNNCRVK